MMVFVISSIFRAVAWRAAERHEYLTEHRAALDVAFSLEQNEFTGETYLELTVADSRPAAEAALVGLPVAATPEPAL